MKAEALVENPEPVETSAETADSLEDVYRREYLHMLRLAVLITGCEEAAEDVVQESFVRLCRNWERTDRPGAYLRTVVVSRCRSWQRRRVLERQPRPRVATCEVDSEARELLDALTRLGVRQRSALVLRFYADMSEADVAKALGCRPGTVKSLVHRGLRQLEGMIER